MFPDEEDRTRRALEEAFAEDDTDLNDWATNAE
jgi:hypothetical protein